MTDSWPPGKISLSPGKRVLFLTKDLGLIKQQLYDGLNLKMSDLSPEDLLDDINTDVMTPAWVCFDHAPSEIAKNCLLYTSPSPRDISGSRMPSSA